MTRLIYALFLTVFLVAPVSAQMFGDPLDSQIADQETLMDQHFRQGDYAQAEAVIRPLIQTVTQAGGPAHIKVLRLRQALANIMHLRGRDAQALQEMEDTYKIWEQHYFKYHPSRMDAAMQLAVHLSRLGSANDALPLALEATRFAETVWGAENSQTLLWQYNTAGILKTLGFQAEALAIFEQVLPLMDASDDKRAASYACAVSRQRAHLLQELGQMEQARAAYADSLIRAQTCRPPHHPETVHTLGEYALLLYELRDIEHMAQIMDQWHAGILASFGADSVPYAEYLGHRALMRSWGTFDTPDFDLAVQDMRETVALRERLLSPTHPFTGRAYLNLGAMEADLGNTRAAWDLALKAEAAGNGSRLLLQQSLWRAKEAGTLDPAEVTRQAFRILQVNYNSAARTAYAALAQRVQVQDAAKSNLMRDFTDMQRRQAQLQDDISYFAGLPNDQRRPQQERQIRAEIAALSEQINAVGARLREQELPFDTLYGADPLTLSEVQAMLAPEDALVILDIGDQEDDWDFIFVATRDQAEWRAMPVSLGNLQAAIRDLRGSIDLRMGVRAGIALKQPKQANRDAFDLFAAHWIYLQTFGVVEDLLEGKTHIYTELRGPMSSVPPQLLVRNEVSDRAQADWMIRHHAMTVIPSVDSLRLTALAGQAVRADKPFLGLADPIFGQSGAEDQVAGLDVTRAALRGALAPLPETAVEVRAVATAVGASQDRDVLAQSMASEAQLKAQSLSDYRVLYFATHGLVAGDMVTAQQQLAEPALALTAGQGEDGLLTASEIASLRLNADWVVLSACNTAVGDEPGAEALSGLAQAFTYAGARALMVSHWPVESRSAVALMTDLFARRAANPDLRAAEAQRLAILAMIDSPQQPAWSHPAYWAPFILVGDPD